jgi:IS30 family transposase
MAIIGYARVSTTDQDPQLQRRVHAVVATLSIWEVAATVSFSEDCVRFGGRLAKLVDAGVPVRDVAESLGISRGRCYAILRATGRPAGSARPASCGVDAAQVAAVFTATGSINQAAKACGVSHGVARRLLVAEGLVPATRQPVGKAKAKRRFFELLASGWSATRAAREVGVHERTGRDWRDGIRKVRNTRVLPDGTVIDYTTGTRYTQPVNTERSRWARAGVPEISSRYLCLPDRLAIADGLQARQTLTVIAAGIGKHTSTVSREIRDRSVDGLYLPYRAHATAAAARARPKQSKLVTNQNLRQAVQDGLSRRLSPEQISHRLVKDFADDEGMRVSHETIYQALYFQARGGLKREVAQALRSGRTRRKPHRSPDQRTHRFVDPMIMISERPAEVADRAVPGHWESQWCCQAA